MYASTAFQLSDCTLEESTVQSALDRAPEHGAANWVNLRHCDIEQGAQAALENLRDRLTTATSFDLSGSHIGEWSLSTLLPRQLTELNISGCILPRQPLALADALCAPCGDNVRSLGVSGLNLESDHLEYIDSNYRVLTHLDLSGCKYLRAFDFRDLTGYLSELQVLNVVDCPNFTRQALTIWTEFRPEVAVFHNLPPIANRITEQTKRRRIHSAVEIVFDSIDSL